jgi:hypothetical protein
MASDFAEKEGLIWLGETSCFDSVNNCSKIFGKLLEEVHLTQTDLVKKGIKCLDDLKLGEEERNVTYNRCCY